MLIQRIFPLILAFAALSTVPVGSTLAQSDRAETEREHRPILPPHDGVRSETAVEARLDGAILQVRCEQTYINRGGRLEEVEVLLPVPADAVVTDGLLLADGREYRAEVLPAEEARRIYEQIVRDRRDPALLELVGHGLVRLSAFPIPPGGERTVSFRYHQPLPGYQGRTRLLLPIAALCGIDRVGPLDLRLTIEGNDPISQVYSPSHDLVIEREGANRVSVTYSVDRPDPMETLELITVRESRSIGIDLRTSGGHGEDDYFLLAVSPGWDLLHERQDVAETQIFVLDTSGSMEGEKFTQARQALHRFLDDASPHDRFNLIAFSDEVRPLFDDGPMQATAENRRRAHAWLDRLQAGGGTAIADAIEEACRSRWEAALVLFLTDGLPTVGETDPGAILARLPAGDSGLRFYAFGVGYDVDAPLLDDLARKGGGSVAYVKPGENIAEAVTTLRRRVEHPCARNVRLEVRGARIRELLPQGPRDLFAGEPLLFVGRFGGDEGRATVRLRAEGPDGRRLTETWQVDFDDPQTRSSAVPVLWASRKAAALIDQIRREGGDRRLIEELQELSRRYGILNEEVALLAREDEPTFVRWNGTRPDHGRRRAHVDAALPAPGGPPMSGGGLSDREMAAEEKVRISAEAWRLHDAGTVTDLKKEGTKEARNRTVEGVAFHLEGDVWTDDRLEDPLPSRVETIRIRAYGAAYFSLARGDQRIAAWLAVGERLRLLLPGYVLEVGPGGEESLPESMIERIVAAAEAA